jgi:hypothetical protein
MRRALITALAATASIALASPALGQTATVNGTSLSTGGSTTISFGGPAGTTASADLLLQLTGADVSTGVYDFSYTFTNTNPSVSNLTAFGFTTDPTLLALSGTGMFFYLNPVSFPGGFDVDACASSSNNNCPAADGQGDLFAGTFELTFAGDTSSITLDNFVARYASLTELGGGSGEGTPITPPVPEPATWAMMLLGFTGIGVALRRSRKRNPALLQIA